ncbi:hypothetical protein [Porphyromonas sp.]|uniref:hypothetical protein n=1 Tax=Porphyromonas sp. TaxID=1924944 RepID=UPI0026DCD945|nr:hypothetical protein [Porphyromonas sp.]MDO4771203.1 hypothetical protein [Porphyromonas sp.]
MNEPNTKNKWGFTLLFSIFLALKILLDISVQSEWGSWSTYILVLFAISAVVNTVWLLMRKNRNIFFKILAILGTWLLVYTSLRFVAPF